MEWIYDVTTLQLRCNVVCRRVYIVRSLPALTRHIADQINSERSAGITHKSYTILFVPRKVTSLMQLLTVVRLSISVDK